VVYTIIVVHHNMVETRKKLKQTNKISQYIKHGIKNELFMSKNSTQKVVRCAILCFRLITTLRPLNTAIALASSSAIAWHH